MIRRTPPCIHARGDVGNQTVGGGKYRETKFDREAPAPLKGAHISNIIAEKALSAALRGLKAQ